ncbi:MAG: hypothetical protein J7497_10755 [Chitinophagaceae bacterium]|nr:hypothetical protein [Chitinophagaceae bacterium]
MNKLWSFFLLILCLCGTFNAHSQSARKLLAAKEDTLKIFADSMINAVSPETRFRDDSNFVRGLVRALKINNSFYYPFDSLKTISRLYAPDSSFRIITWQLKKDEYVYLQKGAIQMNTKNGELKLFPLFDYSMFTAKPSDSARTNNNWIGAIYYKIIKKEYRGKNYYTLLGFDDFSISSNKKWMEVLTFNDKNEPVFGGPFISFKEDTLKKPVQARFNIEYKKEANTLFNYDKDLDMIVFDHLISETDEPARKNTYIPDGSYEGFKWVNGQWVHVDRIFDFKLQDGQFPVDNKLRDDQGNINEKVLEEASQKNIEKANKKKK